MHDPRFDRRPAAPRAMQPIFQTARLLLRPAAASDLGALWSCWASPEVFRYLFDGRAPLLDEADALLGTSLALSPRGLGLWIVTRRRHPEVLGCVGLLPAGAAARIEPSLAGVVEPVAALCGAHQHQGYAQEALCVLLYHAFRSLALPMLAAVTDAPNWPSQRLLRRLGFELRGDVPGPRHRLRTFRLDAANYRDAQSDHCKPPAWQDTRPGDPLMEP